MKLESKIGERLKTSLDALNERPGTFCKRVGIDTATVYNILNGKRAAYFTTIENLCSLEPRFSAEYLLRGKEPVLLAPEAMGCEELKELVKEFNQKSIGML